MWTKDVSTREWILSLIKTNETFYLLSNVSEQFLPASGVMFFKYILGPPVSVISITQGMLVKAAISQTLSHTY